MSNNEKDVAFIPYYIAESMADRQALTIKRLWIMCVLLIVLLVGTNALWLWYESQWEYFETEQTVEQEIDAELGDDGGNFTVIGIGDNYGKSKS